jgi:AmmeMemoRadiSam system protein A
MYTDVQRQQLIQIAKESIQYGLIHGQPLPVNNNEFDSALRELRASFVTLKINHQLRGCIGRLQAERPLVEDVAENAYSAAFRDPRFAPLSKDEVDLLEYHISVLDEPVDLPVHSESELIEQLVPGKDGVIISDGLHRGTFLPSVWESLPKPAEFVHHLKLKAGLPVNGWSDNYRVQRYRVEEF